MNNSSFAFICDTPLQVLNAINFVENDLEQSKGKTDLFLYHQFQNSHELSAHVKESGIFNEVYDFKEYSKSVKLWHKLRTLYRIITPKRTLKAHRMCDDTFLKKDYEKLILSFFTGFSDNIRYLNPSAEVIMIEDGVGTYLTKDLEHQYRSNRFKILNRFILEDRLEYSPTKLYVYNPDLCKRLGYENIQKLPSIESVKNELKSVFNYKKNKLYTNSKIVYLTQPMDVYEKEKDIIKNLINLCGSDNMVIRVHPRQKPSDYQEFEDIIDKTNNVWELECANQITKDSILIAPFSTAQFSMDILFSETPNLIFLYKIFNLEIKSAGTLIELVNSQYNCNEKIFIPESIEELKKIMEDLTNE